MKQWTDIGFWIALGMATGGLIAWGFPQWARYGGPITIIAIIVALASLKLELDGRR